MTSVGITATGSARASGPVVGTEIPINWQGRTFTAWCPAPLVDRQILVDAVVAQACAEAGDNAMRASERLDSLSGTLASAPTAIALVIMRSEAIASSRLEQISVPVEQTLFDLANDDVAVGGVVADGVGVGGVVADGVGVGGVASDGAVTDGVAVAASGANPADVATRLISANCVAVERVIAHAVVPELARTTTPEPLTIETLNDWHRLLMADDPHMAKRHLGQFRDQQGWIGGTNPLDAAFVAPPAHLLTELMADLCKFVNESPINAVMLAALAHVQFEMIHSYADGNGRVGRLLVAWILARRLGVRTPPPMSITMATDVGGYLSAMTLYRQGHTDNWIKWFAAAVQRSVRSISKMSDDLQAITTEWRRRLGVRRKGAAVVKLLDLLVDRPVVDARFIAAELGVSLAVARGAANELAGLGIVEPFHPEVHAVGSGARPVGRPCHWWQATAAIDVIRKGIT